MLEIKLVVIFQCIVVIVFVLVSLFFLFLFVLAGCVAQHVGLCGSFYF